MVMNTGAKFTFETGFTQDLQDTCRVIRDKGDHQGIKHGLRHRQRMNGHIEDFNGYFVENLETEHMGSLEAVVVTPSDPTPTCVLPLSALDSQLFLRFTAECLLVYTPCPGLDRAATSARLKAALAQALVPYYPFASRVRPCSGGSGLEVVCRAQGAVFIEAFSDRYTVRDFDKAPRTVTSWRKFLSLNVPDVLDGSPPLVVQFTWLNDGATAVGVGINHCVCDGGGLVQFLSYFAELASGKCPALQPTPVWNRHLLNPSPESPDRACPVILTEFNRVPDLCDFMTLVSSDLKPTSIKFDKRRLDELKHVARSMSPVSESSSYTSFEVLAAHVWRSWARAMAFPSNQILKILFSIDVRNRVKPGIPDGYYGNALVLGCAQSSTKDLVQKGLGYGSALVRSAKERVDSEYVRKMIKWVSESRENPYSVGVLIVTQWAGLGAERVDFGLGRLIHVAPIYVGRYCSLSPAYGERDALRVMMAVPTSAVDQFQYFLTASAASRL
ncbi:taxadien-5-alpha-ol O-acetyltransferase-like [Neltuma alba]|uniref:taxadien-5-alpha-ol O-acetyltransferase-like n=1 Tax=Neltuma alba TaxID=207710 RepID=UPI0010A3F958|nr:taxadien-5-alpha-ol O-acetyltransferase-like [Prosopis alba]